MKTIIALDSQDGATVLAALRYYQQNGQGDPSNRSDAIHDIATGMADGMLECVSLDDAGIDALCERINVCGDMTGMLEALEEIEEKFAADIENDLEIDGGDAVDFVCSLWPTIKGALEKARGETRDYTANVCSECGMKCEEIIGCPDGREVCQNCFNEGIG